MEEIGARLRAAREGKGISLEVVEEETKIRRKYIEALEEGEIEELPGEVYVKGFLRSYGNYLDLDGDSLVEEYKESKNGRRPGSQAASGEDSAARAAARQERAARRDRAAPTERPGRTRTAPPRPDFQRPQLSVLSNSAARRRVTTVMLMLVVVAAIGYLGWLIALQLNPETGGSTPDSGAPAQGSSDTGAVKTPSTTPPPSTAPVQSPPPKLPDPPKVTMTRGDGEQVVFTVPAREITVKWDLAGSERLWVSWYVDDQRVFEGDAVDARGTVRGPTELKGGSMRLRMGHMRGISLTINGHRFEKPLENGPYTLVIRGE